MGKVHEIKSFEGMQDQLKKLDGMDHSMETLAASAQKTVDQSSFKAKAEAQQKARSVMVATSSKEQEQAEMIRKLEARNQELEQQNKAVQTAQVQVATPVETAPLDLSGVTPRDMPLPVKAAAPVKKSLDTFDDMKAALNQLNGMDSSMNDIASGTANIVAPKAKTFGVRIRSHKAIPAAAPIATFEQMQAQLEQLNGMDNSMTDMANGF